jgi:outer membrane protein TolC
MYVCPPDRESTAQASPIVMDAAASDEPDERLPKSPFSSLVVTCFAFVGLWLSAPAARAVQSMPLTNAFITQPLSLADAVNTALQRNPNILRAQKDLEVAEGVVVQTRAVAVPKINIIGGYSAVARSDTDIITVPGEPGFSFGNDQNWISQIRIVQSLYEGGRILSSLRVARLTREQSVLNYQTAVANTVLDVELAYYDVLLARQQIAVQEASVELLGSELADTTRRFDAGTVPRFNVLRAQVELANAKPRLIRARNTYRIGKNNLANLLGFNVPRDTFEDVPLALSGKLEAEPFKVDLPHAISLALDLRTELRSLRKVQALRNEDVVIAKAGYKPSLQAYVGYDAHNSMLSQDLGNTDYGWITGVQLTWNIFDGLLTRGKVQQATALYGRAGVELDDVSRRIELEVRTAYSNFIEADEVLKSQEKVVEEAEEAVRLAMARNDAGTGTQLDVLSAQTALTEARTTQIQALHDYSAARARLERAVGANIPSQLGQH